MSNTLLSEQFIDIYNRLDTYLRKSYGYDVSKNHSEMINDLANNKRNLLIKRYQDNLLAFARLRNAIVHNARRGDLRPIAEPHQEIVELYQKILDRVMNPPKAIDIATNIAKIYFVNWEDNTLDVMRYMYKMNFSYVPILEDGRVVGVFSENTIFSFLAENEIAVVDKDITVEAFKAYIPLDKHINEFFVYESKNTPFYKVVSLFHKEIHNEKRLAVVFITENGSPQEKLLGMITVWDIASYKSDI